MLTTLLATATGFFGLSLGTVLGLRMAYLFLEGFVNVTGIFEDPAADIEDPELENDDEIAADEERRDLDAVHAVLTAAGEACAHNGGEDTYLRSSLVALARATNLLSDRFDERLQSELYAETKAAG